MWKTIAPAEMKRIETAAMERGLCTGEALMGRAAAAVARAAYAHWKRRGGRMIALCGVGNNGGDAIAALRMLAADESLRAHCLLLDGPLTADARRELDRLVEERPHVPVQRLISDDAYAQSGVLTDSNGAPVTLAGAGCLIDGLFGTGLSRPLTGTAAALCALGCEAREAGAAVVAVDIPSGLCGRTGQVLGCALPADETVTFHRPKPGLFLGQGLALSGRVSVTDIGLLPEWDDADGLFLCQPEEVAGLLPRRSRTGHKGDHGRVVLFCGSAGMAGAAAIAATAALRSGAGLVTVACPERMMDTVQMLCPCATCLPLPTDAQAAWTQLEPLLQTADVLGMGCGLGQSPWVAALLRAVLAWLASHDLPAVIDADALNLLAKGEGSPLDLSRCVFTPHPGEAARLLGCTVPDVTTDALQSAKRLHQQYGAAIVLKGAATVMITDEGAALNVLGTSAMGKGGSGDALTGVLCALLAARARRQEKAPLLSVLQAGCGLHGLAGCAAERRLGARGVLATDLCMELGRAAEAAGCAVPGDGRIDGAGAMGAGCLSDSTALADLAAFTACPSNRSTGCESVDPAAGMAPTDWAAPFPPNASPLGRMVTVTVDRPLGERHPKHRDVVYRLNYGYVQDVLAADNQWQDAYIYGVDEPVEVFEGRVAAVIRRRNDVEDKWVVAAPGVRLTEAQVREATYFMEQYFESEIECL